VIDLGITFALVTSRFQILIKALRLKDNLRKLVIIGMGSKLAPCLCARGNSCCQLILLE
jgi:hypothetical protein